MSREIESPDPVYISWAEAMLAAEGIKTVRIEAPMAPSRSFPMLIADTPFPVAAPIYRLVVAEHDWDRAQQVLEAAKPA